jgi:error-prone DNA polymerase
LIRPGPIQGEFVHPYTRRRRGLEQPSYAHPALEPILKRTYGIPIFQEQAMAVSSVLGGFTPPEADRLRRTMGNIRKKTRLETVLAELTERMVSNPLPDPPVSPEVARQISRDLLTFANYGFPESHAWSFALIAYATAYLKCHYPTDFYLGLLNAQPMGFYPNATIIHEARRRGVEVRSPCLRDGKRICTTERTATSEQPALRIGWENIRGIGEHTLDRLCEAQEILPFTSIADVVTRVGLTRAESLQLARAAAFGAWEPDRRRAAWEALRVVGDNLPFAPAHRIRYDPRELDERELIFLDYQATGICVSGHPMDHLRERLEKAGVVASRDLQGLRDGQRVVVAGLVSVRQQPQSAKGTIFILLEDEWGFINVIVSPTLVARYNDIVKYARFMVVEGRFERDGGVTNVVGRRFRELEAEQLVYGSHDFH